MTFNFFFPVVLIVTLPFLEIVTLAYFLPLGFTVTLALAFFPALVVTDFLNRTVLPLDLIFFVSSPWRSCCAGAGVTGDVAALAGPSPIALVPARTVKV